MENVKVEVNGKRVTLLVNDEVAGDCWTGDDGMLYGVNIDKNFRGRGLSHLLLKIAVQVGNPDKLFVAPSYDNPLGEEGTAKLYEKHGFVRTGKRLDGRWLLMTRQTTTD